MMSEQLFANSHSKLSVTVRGEGASIKVSQLVNIFLLTLMEKNREEAKKNIYYNRIRIYISITSSH